jgi:DNA invertase Pin-like site-specific DNA recombinase
MTIIGYARVSTTDQDLAIQIAALKREGCTTIRSEKEIGNQHGEPRGAAHRARLLPGGRCAYGHQD